MLGLKNNANVKKIGVFFITFFTLLLISSCELAIGNKNSESRMWKKSQILDFWSQEDLDLKDFWKVYNVIKKEYYSQDSIEKDKLVEGAIAGMVQALGDKHSEFMNAETTKKFNEVLDGDFEGIGAVVKKNPLGVKIDRLIKWSPAKKHGVRNNDIVIKANGKELQELDLYDAVDQIKWPAGTTVSLTILRPGEKDFREIQVVRDKITIPTVEEEYFKEENIGYIALNMYGTHSAEEFKKSLKNIKNQNVDGLIIDLRDNGGGYLEAAVEILSEFIEKDKVLVKTKYKDSFFDTGYYSTPSEDIFDKKIVVLVNENSASASEITAGAFKDYSRAIIVGKKTYGKGSVQQPFKMDDGSMLKLTVAEWYTPNGTNINEEGITPNVEIKISEDDYNNSYDRQLEAAKKILTSYIQKDMIGLSIENFESEFGTGGLLLTGSLDENTNNQ